MDQRIAAALEDGATVVTASHRLAHTFREEYNALQQADGAGAWPSPAILPWNGWLSALWDEFQFAGSVLPVRLGPWQERVLWERVIREFSVSNELLQLSSTAAAAQEAWELAIEWRLNLASFEEQGHEDARVFAQWARRFQSICDEQGFLDTARIADYLRNAVGQVRLPRRMLLVGFDEFTPQQQDLIRACRETGCTIELLDRAAETSSTRVVRIPFADVEQELSAAARWARALIEDGTPGTIAVVLPDLSTRRLQVERVFRSVLEPGSELPGAPERSRVVNLSAGQPLGDYPLISSALRILRLSPDTDDWNEVSIFIRDRYIGGAETERTARGILDAQLRGIGRSQLSIADLRSATRKQVSGCQILDQTLARWGKANEGALASQTAGQWCRTFSEILTAVGWPGERALTSAEFQTVEAWKEALSQFAGTDFVAHHMRKSEALSLLSRIVAETVYQPQSPAVPVQILGTLEASGLHFDHLWVAGLHDEAWPGAPHPNPFLPHTLQRAAAMPRCSPERELAFATLVTERLLASAPDIVLSYPTCEDDKKLAPSPLILSVPESSHGTAHLWAGDTYTHTVQQSRAVEHIVDEQGPQLGNDAWQRGGTRVFQYQAGCPFRAFAELRLGAEVLEAPLPGLDARQRGTLVHAALEEVWKQVRTHEALCSRNDIPDVISNAVSLAISKLQDNQGAPLPDRFAALERRRLKRLISDWLEIEKKREPFEVVQPEGERHAEVGGIRFKVKIDRVDRLADSRDVIIDYKTCSTTVQSWDTDRPEEPQLPLYSTIHERPLAGVLFGEVRPGESRFCGIVDGAVVIPGAESVDLAPRITEWRNVLERLGTEFRTGRAEANPTNPVKTCRYCSLTLLCRITETGSYLNDKGTD